MIVYHVISPKKFRKYLECGYIKPPVRAWSDIKEAEKFSISTGRTIILRLKFPDNAKKLDGHKGLAYYIEIPYYLPRDFDVLRCRKW